MKGKALQEDYKDVMRLHREEVRRIKAQLELTIKSSSISTSETRGLRRISILFL